MVGTQGMQGGAQAIDWGQIGKLGVCMHMKVEKMKSGCGGHIESTPPWGQFVVKNPPSDGWQGQMDTSKCSNVAGFGTHACTHAQSAGGRWEVMVGT